MHIKINRKEFLKKLQIVDNAVIEDKFNKVESGVRLEILDNELVLKASSSDLFIKAKLECEVIEKGQFIIKHKLMEEYLNTLEDEIIEIKEVKNKINIFSSKSKSSFSIYQYEEVYEPSLNIALEYNFNKNEFLNNIENVKFSASATSDKQAVNCIRLELESTNISFIASDFHRLIRLKKKNFEHVIDESLSVSIPLKSVNGLVKIMKSIEDETVNFKSDATKVLFKFNDIEVLTKLVEIQYPNYKALLNSVKVDKKAVVSVRELINSLKTISIFVKSNTDKRDVAVFKFKEGNLEISGENDLAITKEDVMISYTGEELEIGLNVRYLLEFLSTIDNNKFVEINLNSKSTPILLNEQDKEETIYLVAPTSI